MISDYSGESGWIESYIHTVFGKLKERNATSVWFLAALPWWMHRFLRYLLLPISILHIFFAHKLKKVVTQTEVDLVWWHSIQRWIWRFPLFWVKKYTTSKQALTVHDFWLYHPFPSQVHTEEQLLSHIDFSSRMKAGFEVFWGGLLKKVVRFLPLCFKYWSSKILIDTITTSIDVILVPSPYMKKEVQQYYPWKKIVVLPHAMKEVLAHHKINEVAQESN